MEIKQGEVVTLSNGRKYLCFAVVEDAGRSYLYLMSTDEPMEMQVGEQTVLEGGNVDVRIVQKHEEKEHLLQLFQQQHANE